VDVIDRARELARPYAVREGTVGAYLVGSATRPQRDELSDLDIEVVVEDAIYDATPDDERQVFAYKDAEQRVVDYEFYLRPWSEFEALPASTLDLFHYPYQHAVILHDPDGRIARIVAACADLPEAIRFDRLRVHYLEFRFALGRARKTRERGGDLNLELLYGDALSALVKALFLVGGSWPATRHWTEQEMLHLGVPLNLIGSLTAAFAHPAPESLRDLIVSVDAWLNERGETFHRDGDSLVAWAFHRTEGRRAFETWAGR